MEPTRFNRVDSMVYLGLRETWLWRVADGGIRLRGSSAKIGALFWAGSDGMDSSSHGRHLGAKLRVVESRQLTEVGARESLERLGHPFFMIFPTNAGVGFRLTSGRAGVNDLSHDLRPLDFDSHRLGRNIPLRIALRASGISVRRGSIDGSLV